VSRTDVLVHYYGGGPLDGTDAVVPLDAGALPSELYCPIPVTVTLVQPDASLVPHRAVAAGVYRLNSARSADDPEGFPGDTMWVAANYRWIGER
jgi:hypothetical protein